MFMKKIVTIAFIVIILSYIIYQNGSSWILKILAITSGYGAHTQSHSSSGPMPPYKDGTYTGNSEDAFYGNIQVKAIISSEKITDVQFLQYPNNAARSLAINTLAMPNLKQEAIQAQDAHVDIVSGATDTSNAFMQSLSSALTQAK
jgi:uncharacterized protein with FMN-binding domain